MIFQKEARLRAVPVPVSVAGASAKAGTFDEDGGEC